LERAKLAFPGSDSSKKARRSSSDSIVPAPPPTLVTADLATTRLYVRDLKDRLNGAGSISEDLSVRVLLFYAKLKEKFLSRHVKDRVEKNNTHGAKLREQVLQAFSLSPHTYQKILYSFAVSDVAYETKRVGNWTSKPTRIPQTRSVLSSVREFVRDRRSRRERVTGRQVLDFMVEKKIIVIPKDRMGFFEKKAFATAVRAVNVWLKKNGYHRGKRMGNIRLKESVAVAREKYLLSFVANRDKICIPFLHPQQEYREVYLDESYCHHHHNHFDHSVWDEGDEADQQDKKPPAKGKRACFVAAIQGPNPRKPASVAPEDQARLIPNSLWHFIPTDAKSHKGDYHKVFNGANFVPWFRDQLLPNLGADPCVIMMDNAKYHLVYGEDVPIPGKMKKAELLEFLTSQSVSTTGEDGRPLTVLLLKAKVKEWIAKNAKPEIIRLAEAKGHIILFTPPYHSDLQPIELLWARIKFRVASEYSTETTMADVKKRLLKHFREVGTTQEGSEAIGRMIEKTARLTRQFWGLINHGDGDEDSDEDEDEEAPEDDEAAYDSEEEAEDDQYQEDLIEGEFDVEIEDGEKAEV
jgi:transposase